MIAPALKLLYLVAGRVLLIDAEDDWSSLAVSSLLARWFVTPLSVPGTVPPHATIRIRCCSKAPPVPEGLARFEITQGGICYTDGQTHYLDFNGSVVTIGPGSSPEADVWLVERSDFASEVLAQVISQAFSSVLRRNGLFELHSGGVVPPKHGKAVLIAGSSGSGKSTLTLQLTACGWGYLSDDTLLIEEGQQGIEAWGLRRFFALTADTMAAVHLPQLPVAAGAELLKKRFTPQDFFPSGQIQRAHPGAIVFPVITFETESRVRSLTPSEAMARLLRLCPWATYDKPTAGEHLRTLGRLVRETVALDILAGTDLLDDPSRASDLLVAYARG
ncbi:MAG: hypothetical protein ND866_09755 [Pyrinomonadaceae bacterium]|nr:hypothetical protein [Pyrinomonadaceae bacterium]